MHVLKIILYAYGLICSLLVTLVLAIAIYGSIHYRTLRAELPNGAYVNRLHPFSDRIVLRAPDGEIVVRDVAHVLYNERYVAGEFYETPYATERFVYQVGDDEALRDAASAGDPFEAMLDASGLEAEWPWGPEDPNWLDFNRLLVRFGYRTPLFPD